ncbi:hypothetical protein C1N66_31805 (plasmid) [Bacillus cereus]|uniref:DUF1572 domain-containing protein n=1 Tax=Bacillus cereus TaxID=1396 RepID=A0AB73UU17_BACCE|nr:DinB family protein [Bacillus cereus]HDR3523473.1 hypothetical protein [Bacillus pacificus]QHV07966.1 hypothetical protein C1N82_32740 [Bacillus cereus]QHV47426.1 hypothetical protein C1N66_30880 [Bacillus cereus]QHV47583.1 hypothetical protein C1N66_31805 [Bacillus cereus]HDR3634030.1 hypothetical protein [Bacillus pacificus]
MNNKETLVLFIKISQKRMYNHYLPKLIHSIQELNSEKLWYKEAPNLNTIGGIVLHICEHVKNALIRFSNRNHMTFNKGIEEFFPNLNLSPHEVIKHIKMVFEEFNNKMKRLTLNIPDKMDIHSLYHLVEHTGYHLGQIVDRSKRITNKSFDFCQNGLSEKNLKTIIELDL